MNKNNALVNFTKSDGVIQAIRQELPETYGIAQSALHLLANSDIDFSKIEPKSIVRSVVNAVLSGLDPMPLKGECYFIPYKDKLQFQLGWRGLVRLAVDSGNISRVGVKEVRQGELKAIDEFGEPEVEFSINNQDKIIGYYAAFETMSGFTKKMFMSKEDIEKHAKEYSQTYKKGLGVWKDNFDSMAKKTVLKLLLSKFAPKSQKLSEALRKDQQAHDGTWVDNDAENAPESPQNTILEESIHEEWSENG